MKNFKNLDIWETGMQIVEKTYKLTHLINENEKSGLIKQLKRAAVSIPSNIAAGASRDSAKENYYFLQIALGSLFQLETQFILTRRLKLLDTYLVDEAIELITEERKIMYAYMKKLTMRAVK